MGRITSLVIVACRGNLTGLDQFPPLRDSDSLREIMGCIIAEIRIAGRQPIGRFCHRCRLFWCAVGAAHAPVLGFGACANAASKACKK